MEMCKNVSSKAGSDVEIDFDDDGSEERMHEQQPESFLAPPASKTKQQRE